MHHLREVVDGFVCYTHPTVYSRKGTIPGGSILPGEFNISCLLLYIRCHVPGKVKQNIRYIVCISAYVLGVIHITYTCDLSKGTTTHH